MRVLLEVYSKRQRLTLWEESIGLLKSGIILSFTVIIRSTGLSYGLFFAWYFLARFPWKDILSGKVAIPFSVSTEPWIGSHF
jgi:hypothetical protein